MTRRIKIRPQARSEILEAYRWYEEQHSGLGAEFQAAVDAVFANLKSFPNAHPAIFGAARRVVMRRFPYVIFYRLRGNDVRITGCIHTSRDPKNWQSRV